MKIDSQDVRLGDWYFYADECGLQRLLLPVELEQIRWDLDNRNRNDAVYALFPKVFGDPSVAEEYLKRHRSIPTRNGRRIERILAGGRKARL